MYIGLTYQKNFKSRLKKHLKNWLSDYRGEKYIRFGEFIKPKYITNDLIEDAESCLIFEMEPLHNKCKKVSYKFSHEYKIVNNGYRGVLPKEISMRDH